MTVVYLTSSFSIEVVYSFLFKVGFFYSVGVCRDHSVGMAQHTVCKFSEDASLEVCFSRKQNEVTIAKRIV